MTRDEAIWLEAESRLLASRRGASRSPPAGGSVQCRFRRQTSCAVGDGKSNIKHGDLTLRIVTGVPDPKMRASDPPEPAGFLNLGSRISVVWPFAPLGRNAALGVGGPPGWPWVSTRPLPLNTSR